MVLKQNNAKKNPMGHEILRKIIFLALLPWEKVDDGLKHINDLIEHFPSNIKWIRFMKNYIIPVWIKEVTSKVFSVFNSVDQLNDFFEEYYITVNGRIGMSPKMKTLLSK